MDRAQRKQIRESAKALAHATQLMGEATKELSVATAPLAKHAFTRIATKVGGKVGRVGAAIVEHPHRALIIAAAASVAVVGASAGLAIAVTKRVVGKHKKRHKKQEQEENERRPHLMSRAS